MVSQGNKTNRGIRQFEEGGNHYWGFDKKVEEEPSVNCKRN